MTLFNELSQAYKYIQFATCVSDQNGQCLQTNAKWQEVTGLTTGESKGLGWLVNVHPDDLEGLLEKLERFRTSKQNGIFQYRIVVDGKIKHIQKFSTPVILNDEVSHFVCLIIDVSLHKEQEQQLNQQNKLLHSLQEIQMGFLTSDNDSKIFEDLLNRILELVECKYGFIAKMTDDTNQTVWLPYAINNLEVDAENMKSPELCFTHMDALFGATFKQGEPVISGMTDENGGSLGFPPFLRNFLGIPVMLDNRVVGLIGLGNRKDGFTMETVKFLEPLMATVSTLFQAYQIKKAKERTEQDNLEKAQYLNILLSSLDDIIFELNEQLEFTNVWTNDPSKLFLPIDQFIGKRYSNFFPPEFCEITEPVMKKVLETGISSGYEYQGIGLFSDRWFSGSDSLVTLSNGEKRLLKQVRDITDVKNSQQAILNARDEAEKATKVKSEFISVMSHEIRTPMNAIIGFVNLLQDERPMPHQVPYLNNLQLSASQLLYLLNNILDYSKLEAGKMQLELAPVSLAEMGESIVSTFSQSAKEKGISIRAEIDPAITQRVVTDMFRLNRILSNLISNAIKFTDAGEVFLEITKVAQTDTDLTVNMQVKDTGIGISKDNLQYIFQEFTQEHSSITRKYGGTGLGLAISNKLVQAFDSIIEVESEKGKGSCFSFKLTLPIAKTSQPVSQEKLATDSNLNNIDVLVVEDNQINALIVQKFITNWGGKSQHALSGAKAIEMLKEQKFHIILMDLQMPDMDGYETTQHIRTFLPDVPIIALTADAMTETKSTVLDSGMNDYITKPFNPQQLKGILEHYGKAVNISSSQ
jgi:PAS domain S-box-containing protein